MNVPPCETVPPFRPPHYTLPRGPFRAGDFWQVLFGLSAVEEIDDATAWGDPIVSAGPPGQDDDDLLAWGSESGTTQAPPVVCPANPAHVLVQTPAVMRFYFNAPGLMPPIIGGIGAMGPVIRKGLADRLRASDLRGVGVCPVEMTGWVEGLDEEWREGAEGWNDLRHFYPEGVRPSFEGSVQPPGGNLCPYCRRGPAVCPGCGYANNPCPACGKMPVRHVKHTTAEEKAAGVVLFDTPYDDRLVDPRRWDGSDYMGGDLVTRRFIDFLLSLHVWPFVAAPVPTLVEGLTKDELAKLDHARRPVTEGGGSMNPTPTLARPRSVRPVGAVRYGDFYSLCLGVDGEELNGGSGLYGDPATAIVSAGPLPAWQTAQCEDDDRSWPCRPSAAPSTRGTC